MKRSLLMLLLLVLLLVVARQVAAATAVTLDVEHDPGPTTERAAFFDHGYAPITSDPSPRSWSSDRGPVVEDGRIVFRYRDRDYVAVSLAGDVVADSTARMHLDPQGDRWEIAVTLAPGWYRYWFVVEDEDGVRRDRTDPTNPSRQRDREAGWVSELRVREDGTVQVDRERKWGRASSPGRYDLDFFADVSATYQRADGLLLSTHPRFTSRAPWSPALEGYVGYGFSSEEWSVRASLLQPLLPDGGLRLVLSAYDQTDFTDRTGVGDFENGVATLVFREDARDWYRREGLSIGVEADLFRRILARVEMRSDVYREAPRTVVAGWGGRGDFLPMLPVDEGLMRSLFARVRVGSDLDHLWVEFEHADDSLLPTEFAFTQLTAQVRRRLHTGPNQYLDVRARFGTALDGVLPHQKRYLAGGIGTVRGYVYQSLLVVPEGRSASPRDGGERLALVNAEYVLGVDNEFAMGLFVDSGNVWLERDADVLDAEWRTSIGLGLIVDGPEDDAIRLDLVKPLEANSGFVVQARLRRPF